MKEFLDVLKNYGILPVVYLAGWIALGLLGLSLIPSLSFVPKAFLLYTLTH
jgi:hypothetical protein